MSVDSPARLDLTIINWGQAARVIDVWTEGLLFDGLSAGN